MDGPFGRCWRDLPQQLGDYEWVKRRYYRWIEMGVLDEILGALAREADLEWLMIDSTIVECINMRPARAGKRGRRMPKALAGPAGA
jgi:hypothetical protein